MALAQCPRSGGSIPSGGFVSSRDAAPARRHAPPCTYPAMIAPSLALSYFHALTEAVPRYDARRRPGVAAPRKTHPADGRPPYFNQTIINVASTAYGGVVHTTTQKR